MARLPLPPEDADLWSLVAQEVEPLSAKPREPQPLPPKKRRVSRAVASVGPALDLHGLTEEQAYAQLAAALEAAQAEDRRRLKVITGKGGGKGLLKEQLPRWVTGGPLGRFVQSVMEASPAEGGSGAYILTLRKPGRGR